MRLDRFLSEQTAHSRKECGALIRSGAVSVNGSPCRKPDTHIHEQTDRITLRGVPVIFEQARYFLMHKPAGVITATEDSRQKTVLDLLAPEDRRKGLFPAGRLDIDTAGLLLLTDDGELAHRMLSPKHHVRKFYLAALRDPFDPAIPQQFAAGMVIREGAAEELCLPAECVPIADRLAVLALKEGKYHQVKRMFAAAGNHVEHLLRVQIGDLPLPPELAPGQYEAIFHNQVLKMLNDTDISAVCDLCSVHYSSYWINEGV